MPTPDLTTYDISKAYINYLVLNFTTYVSMFRLLRKKYHNYLTVGYRMKKRYFPIFAVLRDGRNRGFSSQEEIWTNLQNLPYDAENDILEVDNIRLKGGATYGDINNIFIKRDYSFLPVKGRIVIDIGANIADSSIYFIKQGAKKVFAVEPSEALYKLANTNIALNNLSEQIKTIFAGCSSKTSKESYPPFLSLEEVVNTYSITPDFLKMDCEGCEYDVILNTSQTILECFNHIFIEYHYGYRKLKDRLEKCGFDVRVSGPTYYPQQDKTTNLNTQYSPAQANIKIASLTKPFVGFLYASRAGDDN